MQASRNGSVHTLRDGGGFEAVAVLQGVALAFVASLCAALLLGLAVFLTDWDGLPRTVPLFNYVGILVGSLAAGRRAGRIGWLHGGMVGLLYFLLLTVFTQGDARLNALTSWSGLQRAGISFLVGALGGMFGVGL